MTMDEAAGGAAGQTGRPPFDTSVANQARIYDYLLGGKDNISQVVSRWPYSDRTEFIQAAHAIYSNVGPFTVRELDRTSMGFMPVFSDGAS